MNMVKKYGYADGFSLSLSSFPPLFLNDHLTVVSKLEEMGCFRVLFDDVIYKGFHSFRGMYFLLRHTW